VEKREDGHKLLSALGKQEFNNQVCTATQVESEIITINQDEIYFRYDVDYVGVRTDAEVEVANAPQERVTLSYSLDGEVYQEALTFHTEAGRWVGVKSGMACYREDGQAGGYAEFEYVRYE
jgi:trehalose utilization protein